VRESKSLKLLVVPVVLLAACGDSSSSAPQTVPLKPKITMSSTEDPMSQLISEIYGQALEKSEYRVARKKAFGTQQAMYTALSAGDVQLVGMTTSGLLKASGSTDPLPNTTALQTEAITKALPATLKVGAPSGAEDKEVIACAKTFTDANTVVTLTDLGPKSPVAKLAAPDGFDAAAPMGAAGLKATYQIEFQTVVPTASDKIVEAVKAGTAECGVARSGDPALSVAEIVVLQDDKALVPNDVVLPVISAAVGTPDVIAVLDATSQRLTTEQLRLLNLRLKDGATPEVVANEFIGNVGT
jgi:osmoprotectant transport system substrate-binding protein